MESEVEFFRLVTGEDIVSEYELTDTSYILINPCKVVYMSSMKKGFLSISLMQWVFSRLVEEQVFDLPKNQVLVKSRPSEHMIDHYYHSVEHFSKSELKDQIDFDDPIMDDSDADDIVEETDINLFKEIMDKISKNKKGSLH